MCAMDYKLIGSRIKKMRIKRNLTQVELAKKTGVSASHISNIETAHTKVSLSAFADIANVLDVSLDELVRDSLKGSALVCMSSLYSTLEECNAVEIKIISETVSALMDSLKSSNI